MIIAIRVLLIATLIVCLEEKSDKPKIRFSAQILEQNNTTLIRFQCSSNYPPIKHHAEFQLESSTMNSLRIVNRTCYDRSGVCKEIHCSCRLAGNTFIMTMNQSADANFPKNNTKVSCKMKIQTSNGHIIDATKELKFNGNAFVPSTKDTEYIDFGVAIVKKGKVEIRNGEVEVILKEDDNDHNDDNESVIFVLEDVVIITIALIIAALTIIAAIYCLIKHLKKGSTNNRGHARYVSSSSYVEVKATAGSEEIETCKECDICTDLAICYEHHIFLCQKHAKTHETTCNMVLQIGDFANLKKCSICNKDIAQSVCTKCWKFVCSNCKTCCRKPKGSSIKCVLFNNKTVLTDITSSNNVNEVFDESNE